MSPRLANFLNDWMDAMTNPTVETSRLTATASLWASAFVLAAFILAQAGRVAGNQALAEMAADGNEYALVTTQGGNEELLYVLEKRTGRIFVYEARQNDGLNLLDFADVGEAVTRLTGTGEGK
ncbi:MAG: hypothetical protein KJZ69_07670 [Phycisphaerales bacterium]|nr:hypothetical protein [Phycisphaerales bacterium]